jgi:hypothetical protein
VNLKWMMLDADWADTGPEAAQQAEALARKWMWRKDWGAVITLCRGTADWIPDLTFLYFAPPNTLQMHPWAVWGDPYRAITGILGQPPTPVEYGAKIGRATA